MKKQSAVFLFGDQWGEIDTVLPLILSIKKLKKVKIIIIFEKNSIFSSKKRFENLFKILKKNSDLILYPNYFSAGIRLKNFLSNLSFYKIKKSLLFFLKFLTQNEYKINPSIYKSEIIKKYEISYLFHTVAHEIDKFWLNLKKKPKYVILPHAPTFKGFKFHKLRVSGWKKHDENKKKKFGIYKNYPIGTKFFTSDLDEALFYKKYCPKNIKIIPIGFTRIELDWIKIIKRLKQRKTKKQILLLLGKTFYVGEKELKKKFENVLFFAEKYSYDVKFKYHPRSVFEIDSIIKRFKKISISEATNSVMLESINSDLVISTSKTGSCLDSIAVGKPVVEYYSYLNGKENNLRNEYKINGKVTSLFAYHKLVLPIENFNELKLFFQNIARSKFFLKKISFDQTKALKKISYNRVKVFKKFIQNI